MRQLHTVSNGRQPRAAAATHRRSGKPARGTPCAGGRLEQRLSDTGERLRELGRDEAALAQLLERLQDIFADIPDELDAVQPSPSVAAN